jgi:protein-tyrosine kinase
MAPRQFLVVLRARRALAAALFALGIAGAAAVTLALPPRYLANALVLVEVSPADLLPGGSLPGHLATQADIVTSQRVALRVVDALRLDEDPEAIRRWRLETEGLGSLRHHLSDRLLRDLRVEPAGASSVLTIGYAGTDAASAARVANAFAQAYVELGAQFGRDPGPEAREAREALDVRARAMRDQLDLARGRLVLSGTEAAAEPVDGASRAGPAASADAPSQIRRVRDELSLLRRELEQAERAFDAAARRLEPGPAAGRVPGPKATVLRPAAEPGRPSSPDPLLNGIAGVVAGLLAAAFGVSVAERRDRRIRGARDLALASGAAPIGSLRDAFGGTRRDPGSRLEGTRPGTAIAIDEAPGDTLVRVEPDGSPTRPGPTATGGGAPQPLGQILVGAGLIHPPEVERILAWARREGMRFGEAAVASRLVTSEQLEQALAEQFDYPLLHRGASAVTDEVVAAFDARNPLVADLRRLRARVRAAQVAAPPGASLKCVAVVSAGDGDGKSFLAANLAVTFAQGGQRTLLIDADLRRGRLHRMFGLPNATGLSSMLNRSIQPGAMQRVPGLRQLTVLTRGPDAPNPSELLSRDALGQLLEAFARTFDVVIIDTAGAAEEPDAALVAQRAGAALLVARKDRSSFDGLAELVQGTGATRTAVLGSVLNEA